MRWVMSSAEKPLKDHTTLNTGMSILGKISVGVRKTVNGPTISTRSATTTKVYGRRSASSTIHMRRPLMMSSYDGDEGAERAATLGRHLRPRADGNLTIS